MKRKLTIYSAISFLLGAIGIIVFAFNCEYIGASATVREVHNAYSTYLGGLSAEAMNVVAIVGIIFGVVFLGLGVILILKARKARVK